jgi:hypothetical protein
MKSRPTDTPRTVVDIFKLYSTPYGAAPDVSLLAAGDGVLIARRFQQKLGTSHVLRYYNSESKVRITCRGFLDNNNIFIIVNAARHWFNPQKTCFPAPIGSIITHLLVIVTPTILKRGTNTRDAFSVSEKWTVNMIKSIWDRSPQLQPMAAPERVRPRQR